MDFSFPIPLTEEERHKWKRLFKRGQRFEAGIQAALIDLENCVKELRQNATIFLRNSQLAQRFGDDDVGLSEFVNDSIGLYRLCLLADFRCAYAAMYLQLDTPLHIDFFWYDIDPEWNYASEDFNRLFERVQVNLYPDVNSVGHSVLSWLDHLMDDFDNQGWLWRYHYANISLRRLEKDRWLMIQAVNEFKKEVSFRANVEYYAAEIHPQRGRIRRGPSTLRDPSSRPPRPSASFPQRKYIPPRVLGPPRFATRGLVPDSEDSDDDDDVEITQDAEYTDLDEER